MRRSVVSNKSKPACSAALNNSPLVSVPQPRDCAVWTVCPTSVHASPFGVPWSNRTSTGGDFGAQTLSHELEDSLHLFVRHVELLDDLVDAEILEVLDDGGDREPRPLEHQGTAYPARDALDGRALGPVKCPIPRTAAAARRHKRWGQRQLSQASLRLVASVAVYLLTGSRIDGGWLLSLQVRPGAAPGSPWRSIQPQQYRPQDAGGV